jgi:hypothetical protein
VVTKCLNFCLWESLQLIVSGSQLFRKRALGLLGTAREYLVHAISCGVLVKLVEGHVFFVKLSELSQVRSCLSNVLCVIYSFV